MQLIKTKNKVIEHDATEPNAVLSVILRHFDLQQGPRLQMKHYPLDDFTTDATQVQAKVSNASNALWMLMLTKVKEAVEDKGISVGDLIAQERAWGERSSTEVKKIGKILFETANRFHLVDTKVETVKPYIFVYQSEEGFEIIAEINFTIEMY